jgi:hypothetical protein
MLFRRIVAVSPDRGFGKQLAMALKVAGGAVELHHTLDTVGPDDLAAALWVVHLDGEFDDAPAELLPRLAPETRAIVVVPRLQLASVVEVMQASDRVAAVMTAEDFDAGALSAMARRLLTGEVFGLEKLVMWGVQLHSQLVGDYHEKSLCMSQVAAFSELVGAPRAYREAIEQCLDEMVMNALYDAPVDATGKPIFAGVPTRTRIALRTEQMVVVQYAYDGRRFALSVRDAFGSLERGTVLRVLHKCLHAAQPVDRRDGGAGVGLYLMARLASTLYFHVAPGIATEVVCVFDLDAPESRLADAGFFVEQLEDPDLPAGQGRQFSAGALRAASRRPPDRFVTLGLSLAIVATLVLIVIAAWPRVFGIHSAEVAFTTIPAGAAIDVDGHPAGVATAGTLVVGGLAIGQDYAVVARRDGYQTRQIVMQPRAGSNQLTIELAPQTATVDLDSEPSGAAVEIGGRPMGETPLTLTSLAPGTQVAIAFKRAGYHGASARLRVPAAGEKTHLVEHLEVSDDAARVRFVSDPPGAQVIRIGEATPAADRTYTPAEVLVEAGAPQRFMLTMPGRVPLVIPPFTAARDATGTTVIEKGGALVEGATLHLEAAKGGKVTIAGAPHCVELAVPAECTLAPGSYTVEYAGPDSAHATRAITLAAQDTSVAF